MLAFLVFLLGWIFEVVGLFEQTGVNIGQLLIDIRMFRLIGFLGGTILFFILAVRHIPGFVYYYICAVFCITIILLLILFRIAAKYLDGFWRVWCTRLQRWISTAVMCLSKYTDLPQYSPSPYSPPQQPAPKPINISHPFWWGLVELVVCFILTAFAPLLMIFVLFCFGEALYRESQYRGDRRSYKEKREEVVARQSARMSLEVPLKDSTSVRRESTERAVNYINVVPVVIELQPVRMSQQRKKTITNTAEDTYGKPSLHEQQQRESVGQESVPEQEPEPATSSHEHHGHNIPNAQHELEMDFNERIVRNNSQQGRRSIPLNMTRVTEESRSNFESGDFDRHSTNINESSELRDSLPRYQSSSPQQSPPRSPGKRIGNDKL